MHAAGLRQIQALLAVQHRMLRLRTSAQLGFACGRYLSLLALATELPCSSAQAPAQLDDIVAYVIPHSHDDPGWLHTADDYYVEQVHAILDSVTQALIADGNRTFTQVEIVYFSRWFDSQNSTVRAAVRQLVKDRRLDFSGFSWIFKDFHR